MFYCFGNFWVLLFQFEQWLFDVYLYKGCYFCPVTLGCADPDEEFVPVFGHAVEHARSLWTFDAFCTSTFERCWTEGFLPFPSFNGDSGHATTQSHTSRSEATKTKRTATKSDLFFLFEASTNNAFSCGSLFFGGNIVLTCPLIHWIYKKTHFLTLTFLSSVVISSLVMLHPLQYLKDNPN